MLAVLVAGMVVRHAIGSLAHRREPVKPEPVAFA